ncbi:hypothetical protein ADIWIN_0592 [Winogradskyella psychrotolerans RS-3]|uniref:Uncharacterized protein n=1 Tax=Winogradskyella psychrotolerans RS-3 TaxID=641526 RepID=S7VWK2_9FLAO|nr:hypothetical protein [Winogradskyella psychrotolerans]EPR74491.1 hypothetical protein ADIWIN_0592 [Winogradskyella psychrotolerans RS-3]
MESLQHDLAKQITNYHSVWSKLLANTNFGNYASSLWNVTLKPEDVSVNRDDETFKFQHANFQFDVEVGLSFGDDHSLFTKQVSGQGTFQFIDANIIKLKTLILN